MQPSDSGYPFTSYPPPPPHHSHASGHSERVISYEERALKHQTHTVLWLLNNNLLLCSTKACYATKYTRPSGHKCTSKVKTAWSSQIDIGIHEPDYHANFPRAHFQTEKIFQLGNCAHAANNYCNFHFKI